MICICSRRYSPFLAYFFMHWRKLKIFKMTLFTHNLWTCKKYYNLLTKLTTHSFFSIHPNIHPMNTPWTCIHSNKKYSPAPIALTFQLESHRRQKLYVHVIYAPGAAPRLHVRDIRSRQLIRPAHPRASSSQVGDIRRRLCRRLTSAATAAQRKSFYRGLVPLRLLL